MCTSHPHIPPPVSVPAPPTVSGSPAATEGLFQVPAVAASAAHVTNMNNAGVPFFTAPATKGKAAGPLLDLVIGQSAPPKGAKLINWLTPNDPTGGSQLGPLIGSQRNGQQAVGSFDSLRHDLTIPLPPK